jgi:hypothetical protein
MTQSFVPNDRRYFTFSRLFSKFRKKVKNTDILVTGKTFSSLLPKKFRKNLFKNPVKSAKTRKS